MIAPEIKAQVTHVMKHMKTFGDDLRELGVDLADVNPRLLLRNARAQDARVVCYFVLIDGGDGAIACARRRNHKAVRRWRARRRRYPAQVYNHDGWAARIRCLLCFSRYSQMQRVAHTFVYQNCDWSKVWGSAALSTATFCTTLRQATLPAP